MNNLPLILGALGPIFALILLGLGLRRLGFPGDGFWPAAERLTYFLLFPALLVNRLAQARLEVLNRRQRETCPAADLVVGLQCGGSDAFSGVTANPAVGYAADLLVRAGATAMFSEVTEVRDAIALIARRAATPEVGHALIREMAWYDDYLARGGADRAANTTPGNK